MRDWKTILFFLGTVIAALLVLYVAFFFVFLNLIVDFWWFRSLDYEGYFWLRLLYRYLIPGAVTAFFFAIFFLHFWIASRYLGNGRSAHGVTTPIDRARSTGFAKRFQTGALEVYTPLSLILAIVIAVPFYQEWEAGLLYFFAPDAGINDPVYGHDVSFYMFSLPIYGVVQKELLVIAVVLFLLVAILYWLEHRLLASEKKHYPMGVKVHLTCLAGFVVFFVAWGFMLQRFGLLYTDSHEPRFFGPGFVEMRFQLPLIWLAIVTFLGAAVSGTVFFYTHGRKSLYCSAAFGIFFLLAMGLRQVSLIPSLIDQFIVLPNPVKAEQTFMKYNIEATLAAYGLDDVKTHEFEATLLPLEDLASWEGRDQMKNIPLWDREPLKDVYYQLQGLRPYYNFPTVDEDRYLIDGETRQVNLAARELNFDKLPQEAHTWENMHLRYTHGYGAVMTPAAQRGDQPQEWYLRDLNLVSEVGFNIEHPDIYYGLEDYIYTIVPNKLDVVGISGTSPDIGQAHTGKGGVPIRSLFRKLLFALYFRDPNILFSVNISFNSRMRFRRNIMRRINALTPFLALDNDPYLVVAPKGLYWVQDAYTHANGYPVSTLSAARLTINGKAEEKSFNYIRNSVKIIVNAYDGSTEYYIVDPGDPIVQAYNRAYPGLLKNLREMPHDLKIHLRYPRDIFYHQMKIYAKYHQTDPALFYQQAETWTFPVVGSARMKAYYLTTDLQGRGDLQKFFLLNPMTPIGRDNLSGLAIAGALDLGESKGDYVPQITIFKIRKDVQVDGPAQVEALIDQDPVISEQFTLWDQRGSEVKRGRMIVLPVGSSALYVQPTYMISTRTSIPELVRVIVASAGQVAMERSSATAFAQVKSKLAPKPAVQAPMPPVIPLEEAKAPEPPPELAAEPEPVQEKQATPIEVQPMEKQQIKVVLTGDVLFGFNQPEIEPAAEKSLEQIADLITDHSDTINVVFINGYTDAKGDEAYNQRLSERRAESIRQWLITKTTLPPDKLRAQGFGEANPVAGNTLPDGSDNPAGRAKNRRVEVIIETMKPAVKQDMVEQ